MVRIGIKTLIKIFMKNSIRNLVLASLVLSFSEFAGAQTTVKLPVPDKSNKMTLMESLENRHSERSFSDKQLTDVQLSSVLWAACGINRPESGMITAPSAMNRQDVKVYVCRKDGVWLYLPKENALKQITSQDVRKLIAGSQDFVNAAPVVLLLTSNLENKEIGSLDAGYVSQNICLACTALGLATVPRASMDKEALHKALNLAKDEALIVNNPVGFSK
jgi:nitroreductase